MRYTLVREPHFPAYWVEERMSIQGGHIIGYGVYCRTVEHGRHPVRMFRCRRSGDTEQARVSANNLCDALCAESDAQLQRRA
jgi:hypothetical protein